MVQKVVPLCRDAPKPWRKFGRAHLSGAFEHVCSDTGLGANAYGMVLSNLLDEFLFRQGLGMVIDLKPLLLKSFYGALADIFEEEQTEFASCEWTQHARAENAVIGLGCRCLVVDQLLAETGVQIAG